MPPSSSNLNTLFLNNIQTWLMEEREDHLQAMADLGVHLHQPISSAVVDDNGIIRSFVILKGAKDEQEIENQMGLLGTYLAT